MPAKSKAQKTAMCMALAARKGDLEVSKLKGSALEIYNSDMTNKEIEEFTVMESLQKYINKNMKNLTDYINESISSDARDLFMKVISGDWDEKLYNKISKKVGVFTPNNQQLFSFMKSIFNLVEKRKVDPFSNLNWIDTSKITSMYMMFKGKHVRFNMKNWDTSNVTNFSNCFADAFVLRNTIEDWDISSAEELQYMFTDATVNCDLSKWVIDNTKSIRYINIFKNCKIDKKNYPLMKENGNDKNLQGGYKLIKMTEYTRLD